MADPTPVFGRLFVASQLEEAVIKALVTWFPSYLKEAEKQLNLPLKSIERPKYYTNRNAVDASLGENLPRVIVVSPGIAGTPVRKGDRTYMATWRLGVAVACTAREEGLANELAKIYGACARGIILKNAHLSSIRAIDIRYEDENYDDLPIPNQATTFYKVAAVYFMVDIDNVANARKGPDVPDQGDYAFGQVQDVIIDLVKESLT